MEEVVQVLVPEDGGEDSEDESPGMVDIHNRADNDIVLNSDRSDGCIWDPLVSGLLNGVRGFRTPCCLELLGDINCSDALV